MPSSYQLENVTYDPFDVVTGGPLFLYNSEDLAQTFISGISVMTKGFIYDLSDIWELAENCEQVTWTVVS